MPLLSSKSVLVIAVVTDIGCNARTKRVSATALTTRHRLRARHLEPILQGLVREGILDGRRGPHGGYTLGRDAREVTANDILRAVGILDGIDESIPASALLSKVVYPALAKAEDAFSNALSDIKLEDLIHTALSLEESGRGSQLPMNELEHGRAQTA
jgi:Rrf2 family protein